MQSSTSHTFLLDSVLESTHQLLLDGMSSYSSQRNFLSSLGFKSGVRVKASNLLGIPISYCKYKKDRHNFDVYSVYGDVKSEYDNLLLEELSRSVFIPSGAVVLIGNKDKISAYVIKGLVAYELESLVYSDLLDVYVRRGLGENSITLKHIENKFNSLLTTLSYDYLYNIVKPKEVSRVELKKLKPTDSLNNINGVSHAMHNVLFDPSLPYFNRIRMDDYGGGDQHSIFELMENHVFSLVIEHAKLTSKTSVATKVRGTLSDLLTPDYIEAYTRLMMEQLDGRLDKRIITIQTL